MSKFRRFFSVILAASMVMGSVPASISADDYWSYDFYETSDEGYTDFQEEDEEFGYTYSQNDFTPEIEMSMVEDDDSAAISFDDVIYDTMQDWMGEENSSEHVEEDSTGGNLGEAGVMPEGSEDYQGDQTEYEDDDIEFLDALAEEDALTLLSWNEDLPRRYEIDDNGSYFVYSSNALLIPEEVTAQVSIVEDENNYVQIYNIPEEMTAIDYTAYSCMVFLTGNVSEHIVYVPDLVEVSEEQMSLNFYAKTIEEIENSDIYDDFVVYDSGEIVDDQNGISFNIDTPPYLHGFFKITANGSVDMTLAMNVQKSKFRVNMDFTTDFDMMCRQSTFSSDLPSGFLRFNPAETIEVSGYKINWQIQFNVGIASQGAVDVAGKSENHLHYEKDGEVPYVLISGSTNTEYYKIRPLHDEETTFRIVTNFSGDSSESYWGLNRINSSFYGSCNVNLTNILRNRKEYERGISREGEEEEKGIIHYCAVDGREHDYCVTAKSETCLNGNCIVCIWHPIGSDDVIVDTDFKGQRKETFYRYCDERDSIEKTSDSPIECENYGYLVTAKVHDRDGNPVEGVEVKTEDYDSIQNPYEKAHASGITDENGVAYLYRRNGSYKFTAGDPVLKSVEDVIEGQPITIEFVVPPREITSVDVALPIPKEKDENLAKKEDMDLTYEPDDPDVEEDVTVLDPVQWKDQYGKEIEKSIEGQQYLTFTLKADEQNGIHFAENCDVTITNSDTSSDANQDYSLISVSRSEDATELVVVVKVNVKPHVTYHVKLNDALWGDGDYEPGDTVVIIAKPTKEIIDQIKERIPGPYRFLFDIAIKLLPGDWNKKFLRWDVNKPDSLKFPDDFLGIPGADLKMNYVVATFTMPEADVELTAIYGKPKEIEEVKMDFLAPTPGERLTVLAESDSEGIESPIPYVSELSYFPMSWGWNLPWAKAEYDTDYNAYIPLAAKSGYEFKGILGQDTKAYVPKPIDSDSQDKYVKADYFVAVNGIGGIMHSYHTPKAQLLEIIQPSTIYFDNGTEDSTINNYLIEYPVQIVTEAGTDTAFVKWGEVVDTSSGKAGRFEYDKSLKTGQKVMDTKLGIGLVKGKLILPDKYRNTETATHKIVNQEVEVTVYIRGKEEEPVYAPSAKPDPGTYYGDLEVTLRNDERNPNATIYYQLVEDYHSSDEFIYDGTPVYLKADEEDKKEYIIVAYAEQDGKKSEKVYFHYTLNPKDKKYTLTIINGISQVPEVGQTVLELSEGERFVVDPVEPEGQCFSGIWYWTEEGQSTREFYSHSIQVQAHMPGANLELKAGMNPRKDMDYIYKVDASVKIPKVGEIFENTSAVSTLDAIGFYPGQGTVNRSYRSSPEPKVIWNVPEGTAAEPDKSYSGSITYFVYDLKERASDEFRENVLFNSDVIGLVNGSTTYVKTVVGAGNRSATLYFTYSIPEEEYVVNYDANGGSDAPMSQIKSYGKDLELSLKKPIRSGYQFKGWAKEKDGEVLYQPGDLYKEEKNITLYAVWEEPKQVVIRAVVVDPETGSVDPSIQTISLGADATIRFLPKETETLRYYVKKVTLQETGGSPMVITDRVKNNELVLEKVMKDCKVTVQYDILPHTVTASVSGGHGTVSPETQNVEHGKTAVVMITAEDGYQIDQVTAKRGKASPIDMTKQVKDGKLSIPSITTDVEVVVTFKARKYTVTYDGRGGTNVPEKQVKIHGEDLKLSDKIPEQEGKVFKGWSKDEQAAAVDYQPESVYKEDADITLYAVWDGAPEKKVSVEVDKVGPGIVSPKGITWIPENGDIEIEIRPLEEKYAHHYIDTARLYNEETNASIDVKDQIKDGKLSLKGVKTNTYILVGFKTEPHTVTAKVKGEGGRAYPESAKIEHEGRAMIMLQPESGYKLKTVEAVYEDGSKKDLTKEVKNDYLEIGPVTMNIDITAEFEKITYTVTYDGRGGTNVPEKQVKIHGEDLKLSDKIPEQEGKIFKGWSKDEQAAAADYQPGNVYKEDADITLYAVWDGAPQKQVSVEVVKVGPGFVSPEGITWIPENGDIEIEIRPLTEKYAHHYLTSAILYNEEANGRVDVTDQIKDGKLLLKGVKTNTYLLAGFATEPHTVTAKVEGEGGIVTPESAKIDHKKSAMVFMQPDYSYKVKSVQAVYEDGHTEDFTDKVQHDTIEIDEVTMNIDFTVSFERVTYTVAYDGRGGGRIPENQVKYYDEDLKLSKLRPILFGRTFKGWSTEKKALTVDYNPGDLYTGNEDIILYAVWDGGPEKKVSVQAEAIGPGKVSPTELTWIDEKGDIDIEITPDAEDYTTHYVEKVLVYDSDHPDGADKTAEVKDGKLSLKGLDSNTYVEVTFATEPHKVTAKVEGNGGSVSPVELMVEHHGDAKIAITTEKGFTLKDAYAVYENGTKEDLKDKVKDDAIVLPDVAMNIAVTVSFEESTFIVHYDGNGGSDVPEDQIKYYTKDLTLSETVPLRAGYDFIGWAVEKDAAEADYQPGDIYTDNADLVLYAVWNKIDDKKVKLTTKVIGKGTITPAEKVLQYGESVDMKFVPGENYVLKKVMLYDEKNPKGMDVTKQVDKNGILKLEKITSDTKIEGYFEKGTIGPTPTPTITPTPRPNPNPNPNPNPGPSGSGGKSSPDTGDSNAPFAWMLIAMGALMVVLGLVRYKRR